jgi:hypothetical protein
MENKSIILTLMNNINKYVDNKSNLLKIPIHPPTDYQINVTTRSQTQNKIKKDKIEMI